MQEALRVSTRVLPGGKIELSDLQIPTGKSVDVIVLFSKTPEMAPHSILDVLNENPTQGCFQSAEEVDAFIEAERNAWKD